MFSKENKKNYIVIFIIFFFGLLFGYFLGNNNSYSFKNTGNEENMAGNISNKTALQKTTLTAKEALKLASEISRAWSKDSKLSGIELFSKKFNEDGTSNGWKIIFYSEEKNKLYAITIKDGESRGGTETLAEEKIQTLKGEIVDSPALSKAFSSLGLEKTEIISIKMYYDKGIKKFIWTIFYSGGSHSINAEF